MAIEDIIQRTGDQPMTGERIVRDLHALGVQPGMTLLVHASLSSLGWVCGGAQAVVLALEAALGEEGTLVMPAHSSDWTDPANWANPPVPPAWWPVIREHWPAYDPDLTPTRRMGAIAETFRRQRGTCRSAHPAVSFVARGPHAEHITGSHALDFGFGDDSPLARVYELDGHVLLLGVDHSRNTSLHLAEYRAEFPGKRYYECGSPVSVDGQRTWRPCQDVESRTDDFPAIGDAFAEATGLVQRHKVGLAEALLVPQRALVDFATTWMQEHRQ